MFKKDDLLSGVYGFIVGDALGVPVEFKSREFLKEHPVIDMQEMGTHKQPKGTWSDDTSMVLATMDAMSRNVWGIGTVMENFYRWLYKADFTATGKVFDVGNTTAKAIQNYATGEELRSCGCDGIMDNGNGSLMRMLPLVYYVYYTWGGKITPAGVNFIEAVSSLTHAHNISKQSCVYYVYAGIYIKIYGKKLGLKQAIKKALSDVEAYYKSRRGGIPFFYRDILNLPEHLINSSGYVEHSLGACIWCLCNTSSYKEAVLKAVNLGGDTDTIGALTGGLAGLYYGKSSIPAEWIKALKGKLMIKRICDKFWDTYK
jgi:ADP-ribosylglycohydrolase